MSLIVGLDLAKALGLPAESLAAVQVSVVVDLEKGLELDAEALDVMHHAVMVIRNPPRARIDVQVLVKFALLREPAQFGIAVAAAKAPVAATGSSVVLQDLNRVAGVAQLVRGGHPGHAGAENED